ncbi:MAG: biopolymer transporter ExbD, partial [Cyclobacteriaceae bacterium]|nr:biopolymer transporter ExbD [Cyclobacteriaceae bacterium]
MSKFRKKTSTTQEIPLAALPDIIFMLLFFFMVTTVLRESDILVEQHIPQAREL